MHELETRTIEINGMEFTPLKGVRYSHDYMAIYDAICNRELPEVDTFRTLILQDLWFLVYFVLRINVANHPFVIDACRDVESGPDSSTLDLWAREHFKSTIITVGDTIQATLKNPEERTGIFSYTRPIAKAFLRQIKSVFEESTFLKACFPDVLYKDPVKEAPKWSEEDGIIVRRTSFAKESTIEAWGLVEGMPTSKHFTRRVYDDPETADMVNSPEMMEKTKQAFYMSENLGTFDGKMRIIGTTYHHIALLQELRTKKKPNGELLYHVRIKPATVGGHWNGKGVLLSKERLDILRSNKKTFASQQLLNPTPTELQVLNPLFLKEALTLPTTLYKFMAIDPAGEAQRRADSWAIMCFGVEPYRDDIGASDLYILDLVIEPLSFEEALKEIVSMYLRNGKILRLGVEKVAASSTEIHVVNALRAKGKHLSEEAGNLVILRPGGRPKEQRIEGNLSWPLNNGKIHFGPGVKNAYRERMKLEMQQFPNWHDDGIDCLAYGYDLITDYRFAAKSIEKKEKDPWWKTVRAVKERNSKDKWLVV